MTDVRLPSVAGGLRGLASLIAIAVVLALLPLSGARAEGRLNMTVLAGSDNIAAAIAWSQHTFDDANNVMLGRSDVPPDNLASGLLQGDLNGPLLLNPTNSLDDAVETELERLEAVVVHILGGTSAISAGVESALRAAGYAVRRYAGATRLETAQEIARREAGTATSALLARAFGTPAGDETAAWADALAGGAWSAEDDMPVLFTQSETLSTSTRDYIQSSRIRNVTILGGTAAISDNVKTQLEALGVTVQRVSGSNRFATAIEIAKARGFDNAGDPDSIVLADGQNANAWAAGFTAAAFAVDKPIVLSNGAALPPETDTWFTGGTQSKNLIVAPFVTEAAADAAADKLGLPQQATVTLDATTFTNNGTITGKITPLTDVSSATISGPCVTDGTLSLNSSTGAFSTTVTQSSPGSCTLTITVTYNNNATRSDTFTVTITGPGPNTPVTNAPELISVAVANTTPDHVLLRYTFDEPVIIFDAPTTTKFTIFGFDGQRFTPAAPTGDPVRPDTDTKSVRVSFLRPQYERSTTAVVDAGAVKSTQSSEFENPEGSFGLQTVAFEAGRTAAPDLVSVSVQAIDKDTTAAVDPVIRATFTFDKAATRIGSPNYVLTAGLAYGDGGVTAGEDFSASYISGDKTTSHVMEVSDPAWDTMTEAQAAAAVMRRAHVPANSVVDNSEALGGLKNAKLTVQIGATSDMTINHLVSVTLNDANDTATFQFDDAPGTGLTPGDFFVYDHNGGAVTNGTTTPTIDVDNTAKTVTVSFGPGGIDGQTTGAGYIEDAVTDGEYETKPAVNGAHSYGSGVTLAPDLLSATRTATSSPDPFGGSSVSEYGVSFIFNKEVDSAVANSASFKSYTEAGTDGTSFQAGQCVVDPSDAKKVVCKVGSGQGNFTAVANAVLFAIVEDAVTTADPENIYGSYPSARPRT